MGLFCGSAGFVVLRPAFQLLSMVAAATQRRFKGANGVGGFWMLPLPVPCAETSGGDFTVVLYCKSHIL